MENKEIETLLGESIKAIVKKVLEDLKEEMPKSNSWQYEYAFEEVARKYGVEI